MFTDHDYLYYFFGEPILYFFSFAYMNILMPVQLSINIVGVMDSNEIN